LNTNHDIKPAKPAIGAEELLMILKPTEAEIEAMSKFTATRAKLYKKEAQEQRKERKARNGKGKEKENKVKTEPSQRCLLAFGLFSLRAADFRWPTFLCTAARRSSRSWWLAHRCLVPDLPDDAVESTSP